MSKAEIGIYGLGTMGSALALNLADNGFRVAVSNREIDWIAPFVQDAGPLADRISGHPELKAFVQAVARPRTVLMMIPSGAPVDDMIAALTPLMEPGDTIIDGGNSDFNDTSRRAAAIEPTGLHFIGMGVSGGEVGARNGPSMMIGGTSQSWARFKPMADAIAAKYRGSPCAAHLGPAGAGHFVKTVHNGIEYADMQMIAEIYGVLRDQTGMDTGAIGAVFEQWRDSPLASYLIDVSANALNSTDAETGAPMLEVILDRAGQKGTGRWSLIEALKMGQSASTIEAAVGARSWSSEKDVRVSGLLTPAPIATDLPSLEDLADAMLAGRILGHGQGFRILSAASTEFGWDLDLARIAEIWRAGCIIRSVLLDDIATACRAGLPHDHLVLSQTMREKLAVSMPGLRRTVAACAALGQPAPALSAALCWHDSLALGRGTANMIQAQRDYFGNHGFARTDRDGSHHGTWRRDRE